jgi:hypothetical protein
MAKVFLSEALHSPDLWHNLISVSQLTAKGLNVTFNEDSTTVNDEKGRDIFVAQEIHGLYVVDVLNCTTQPSTNLAESKQKPVPFDTWHCRLAHAGEGTLKEMMRSKLVDGLEIDGQLEMRGKCEDCIYGKHTAHLHNEKGEVEKEVLEQIHVDLWGPATIQSAGGAKYLMVIVDGASSYRTVFPIHEKTAEMTMRCLKEFVTKAELQTGKKVKWIRLDMGWEWMNALWDTYTKEKENRIGIHNTIRSSAEWSHWMFIENDRWTWEEHDGRVRTTITVLGWCFCNGKLY